MKATICFRPPLDEDTRFSNIPGCNTHTHTHKRERARKFNTCLELIRVLSDTYCVRVGSFVRVCLLQVLYKKKILLYQININNNNIKDCKLSKIFKTKNTFYASPILFYDVIFNASFCCFDIYDDERKPWRFYSHAQLSGNNFSRIICAIRRSRRTDEDHAEDLDLGAILKVRQPFDRSCEQVDILILYNRCATSDSADAVTLSSTLL